jgi:hypothetical protein
MTQQKSSLTAHSSNAYMMLAQASRWPPMPGIAGHEIPPQIPQHFFPALTRHIKTKDMPDIVHTARQHRSSFFAAEKENQM